jgi:histone H3/H4
LVVLFVAAVVRCSAWACTSTEKTRRRTLQKEDIQAAIQRTDIFDFLVRIICPEQ